MSRLPISPKDRWEVFQRDNFTCQYCGAKGQDVQLHVDHVVSVADGGSNEPENLKTACVPCNSGKGARSLYHLGEFFRLVAARDYEAAPEELAVQAAAKFRGSDLDWIEHLLRGVRIEVALYHFDQARDWKHLVESLCRASMLEHYEERFAQERDQWERYEKAVWLRLSRQWLKPESDAVTSAPAEVN